MADETAQMHAVVKLLLTRMDSHPDEFSFEAPGKVLATGRWRTVVQRIYPFLTEEEKNAFSAKAREIVMGQAHEAAMKELLEGPTQWAETGDAVYTVQDNRAVTISEYLEAQKRQMESYHNQIQNAQPLSAASSPTTWSSIGRILDPRRSKP